MSGINHLKEMEDLNEAEIEEIERQILLEDENLQLDFSKFNEEKMNDDE